MWHTYAGTDAMGDASGAQSIRIAIRTRYGRAVRFLASLTVAAARGYVTVQIFDLPGPARIYAWLSPRVGKLIVITHGGDIRSPQDAVRFGAKRQRGLVEN